MSNILSDVQENKPIVFKSGHPGVYEYILTKGIIRTIEDELAIVAKKKKRISFLYVFNWSN